MFRLITLGVKWYIVLWAIVSVFLFIATFVDLLVGLMTDDTGDDEDVLFRTRLICVVAWMFLLFSSKGRKLLRTAFRNLI
jgi:type III secretory pathway component EscS